jgi:hypothetical protein
MGKPPSRNTAYGGTFLYYMHCCGADIMLKWVCGLFTIFVFLAVLLGKEPVQEIGYPLIQEGLEAISSKEQIDLKPTWANTDSSDYLLYAYEVKNPPHTANDYLSAGRKLALKSQQITIVFFYDKSVELLSNHENKNLNKVNKWMKTLESAYKAQPIAYYEHAYGYWEWLCIVKDKKHSCYDRQMRIGENEFYALPKLTLGRLSSENNYMALRGKLRTAYLAQKD